MPAWSSGPLHTASPCRSPTAGQASRAASACSSSVNADSATAVSRSITTGPPSGSSRLPVEVCAAAAIVASTHASPTGAESPQPASPDDTDASMSPTWRVSVEGASPAHSGIHCAAAPGSTCTVR